MSVLAHTIFVPSLLFVPSLATLVALMTRNDFIGTVFETPSFGLLYVVVATCDVAMTFDVCAATRTGDRRRRHYCSCRRVTFQLSRLFHSKLPNGFARGFALLIWIF